MDKKRDGTLAAAISALEEQRDKLASAGEAFVAHLLGVALLELRRRHHGISEEELGRLEAMAATALRRDAVVEFSPKAHGITGRVSKSR